MVCEKCKVQMEIREATKEHPYHYVQCGLDHVELVGIQVHRCPQCGNEAPRVPRIRELHRALNNAIAKLPTNLSGQHIRFIRKFRGYAQKDFAELLNIRPESLCRIEHNKDKIGTTLEHLIRSIALNEQNVLEVLTELREKRRDGRRDEVTSSPLHAVIIENGWQVSETA